MAKKRKKTEKIEREKEIPREPVLRPEARHGIGIVVLFTLAVLFILSLFNVAGGFGELIDTVLNYLFGWGKFFFPVILLVLGFFLLKPEKYIISGTNYLGLVLFVLSYSGLLHLFVGLEKAVEKIAEGSGGGYAGLLLSYPLQKIMGFWASLIVLLAVFLVSLILMYNTSLQNLAEKRGKFSSLLYRVGFFFSRLKKEKKIDYEEAGFSKREIEIEKEETGKEPDQAEIPLTTGRQEGNSESKAKKPKIKIKIPIDLLESSSTRPKSGDIELNKLKIRKTLENFGIEKEPTASGSTMRRLKLPWSTVALQSDYAIMRIPYTATNVPRSSACSGRYLARYALSASMLRTVCCWRLKPYFCATPCSVTKAVGYWRSGCSGSLPANTC